MLRRDFSEDISHSYGFHQFQSTLSAAQKIDQFMFNTPWIPQKGEIVPLVAAAPSNLDLADPSSYDAWLDNKTILRTEKFFNQRPSWNVASTRHALLGNYQFKGIGVSAPLGRVDYGHVSGRLQFYVALYETLMSWHLAKTPVGAQQVVAIWRERGKELTNCRTLILREAKSTRLAQVAGLRLTASEKALFMEKQGIGIHIDDYLRRTLTKLAWLIVNSYEILAPTSDNLLLDGSCIDCAGIYQHPGKGMALNVRLVAVSDGKYKLASNFAQQFEWLVTNYHEAFQRLGSTLTVEDVRMHILDCVEQTHPGGRRAIDLFCHILGPLNFEEVVSDLSGWDEMMRPLGEVFSRDEWMPIKWSRFLVSEDLSVSCKFRFGKSEHRFETFRATDALCMLVSSEWDNTSIDWTDAIWRAVSGSGH